MSRSKEELAGDWLSMLEPISLAEFCGRWVPVIYGVEVGERGKYSKAAVDLLARVVKVKRKTVQNWLSGAGSCSEDTLRYLGVVDKLWRVRSQILPVSGKK
jgi:hypothetical protein